VNLARGLTVELPMTTMARCRALIGAHLVRVTRRGCRTEGDGCSGTRSHAGAQDTRMQSAALVLAA
jgi:hypothetical protein